MTATSIDAQSHSALTPALSHPRRERERTARGFSLTELLVVIGIIVLLVGILLVALGKVQDKARRTKSEALMNSFVNACTAFQAAHNRYPGVIPDDVLLANPGTISSTENALLDLMGGYRLLSPYDLAASQAALDYTNFFAAPDSINTFEFTLTSAQGADWKLKVDKRRVGEGPIIDGKPQEPMFSAKGEELLPVKGQVGDVDGTGLPDLIDAWGQPIIYIRRVRERGPLAGPSAAGNVPPQFLLGGVASYLGWPEDNTGAVGAQVSPGEFELHQVHGGADPLGSVLTSGSADQRYQSFAMIVRHPGVSAKATAELELLNGSSRGAIVLISAGPDGIYYSAGDGEASPATPEPNIAQFFLNPDLVKAFDDIIIFGGG